MLNPLHLQSNETIFKAGILNQYDPPSPGYRMVQVGLIWTLAHVVLLLAAGLNEYYLSELQSGLKASVNTQLKYKFCIPHVVLALRTIS